MKNSQGDFGTEHGAEKISCALDLASCGTVLLAVKKLQDLIDAASFFRKHFQNIKTVITTQLDEEIVKEILSGKFDRCLVLTKINGARQIIVDKKHDLLSGVSRKAK